MSRTIRTASLQVNAGNEMTVNVQTACALARRAKGEGADMVLMPENVAMMTWGRDAILGNAHPEDSHPALVAFRDLAANLGLWMHCGTLAVSQPDGRVANRTYVLDPSGGIAARYDKIHMFDVDLDGGESYRESAIFAPGAAAVTVDLPWGRMGLSICYDLRFPHLYRTLAQAGAELLVVPSAFTRQTGEAHWHALLRARAIETGSWVLAPAQTGTHPHGRQTFGHTLAVAPWGEVIADAGVEPGMLLVAVDLEAARVARGKIPSLAHDRAFSLNPPDAKPDDEAGGD
ncbi:carbon-nitrogen hydrolase family protein [Roseospirillum parvum]|uniref:Predicted amidohydrolase n=1 Tax=Roseospirillum parvum TaxID=83401 RepID=A0A1G7U760_9PROT|nr:carbon-nitrogen hydrolase family protein [Roseospirillum parvum]SDG43416.1 Predicted amidohydrolase [Roseospirillum parvum]